MSDKLTVSNLYKVFDHAPEEALALAREGLSKDEIFQRTGAVVAVNDVSFSVPEGEIFVVMGLSGSGKSTLVRCLNRLIEPTRATVMLDDVDVTKAGPETLRQIRLRRMSMVFQHFALFPHRTVSENVEYGLKARGMPAGERRERAITALERVGLDAWADVYPDHLSGGMQQRVGLARGLAVDPEVLLMDEPFSALDPLIRRDVQDELIRIQQDLGTTIVFITHDLQEALKLGDRIAIMKDGRFVQVGSPEQIVTTPADDYVSAFTRDVDRSRVLTLAHVMSSVGPVDADMGAAELRSAGFGKARFVPVTDGSGRPIGFVRRESLDHAGKRVRLADLVEPGVRTASAGSTVQDVFGDLGGDRPVAVVDSAGRYLGLVEPAAVFAHLRAPEDSGDAVSEHSAQAAQ